MSIIGDLTGLGSVAEAANGVTKSITDLLGKFIPDPNVKAQMETEVTKIIADGQKAQYDAMSSVMVADAKSDSAYTRAARPTVVYWSLAMVTLIAGAGLVGHAQPMIDALNAAPHDLWDTIRYSIGIYAGGRTVEKVSTSVVPAVINSIKSRKK